MNPVVPTPVQVIKHLTKNLNESEIDDLKKIIDQMLAGKNPIKFTVSEESDPLKVGNFVSSRGWDVIISGQGLTIKC